MTDDIFTRAGIATACAVLVSVIRYGTYIISILKRESRPHFFSWFNWSVLTGIGAAGQFSMEGGLSAWILLMVASMCFLIALLSLVYGEKNITRGDWITFIGALITIPIWLLTKNPVIAFVLLICIDVCSYYPTWRKMWLDPWSEPTDGFFWAGLRYFFALWAVPEFTFAVMLYPFWLMASDWSTGVYMIWRRRVLRASRPVTE